VYRSKFPPKISVPDHRSGTLWCLEPGRSSVNDPPCPGSWPKIYCAPRQRRAISTRSQSSCPNSLSGRPCLRCENDSSRISGVVRPFERSEYKASLRETAIILRLCSAQTHVHSAQNEGEAQDEVCRGWGTYSQKWDGSSRTFGAFDGAQCSHRAFRRLRKAFHLP